MIQLLTRWILPAALLLPLATSARAQGTEEQREACTPDALKLCSDTIPDIPKTTACMRAHEAALSPRCRAVFNEPATKEPTVAAASKAIEATRKTRSKRASLAREERPEPPGGPADLYDGPDIRHFAPGDGPDQVEGGPPPYGDGGYDGGPRYFGPHAWDGPRGWDGPRFAYRDRPDGYDGPRPRRGGPSDFDGPPDGRRDGFGPRAEAGHGPRHRAHPAQIVIARMCARGEIDPRTCSETLRALERRHY